MSDSDSEETMPAFRELLGEFSSAIRGHERGYPVEKEISEAREALLGYVAELTAENERLTRERDDAIQRWNSINWGGPSTTRP